MVGTSQKWPAKAGGRSPKGPAVAGTTVQAYQVRCFIETENTKKNTNLRELADVKEALPSGTSQRKRCQCHSNHC